MTDTAELSALVTRLETLLGPAPAPLAATDAYGNPGAVAAGELIESAWGNAAATHVVRSGPIAARPATPHVGAQWYATDDKKMYVYHATSGWVRADWNQAWGWMGSAGQTANFGPGGVAGEMAMLVSPVIPFVEGRRMRVVVYLSYSSTVAGDYFTLAIRAGTTIGGALQRLNRLMVGGPTEGDKMLHFETMAPMNAAAGSPTQWVFTVNRTVGSGNIVFYGNSSQTNAITVYDDGPVTRI